MRLAARALAHGALVAYPTEGVYGLGCDPLNEAAVLRLLAVKDRDPARGLILLTDDRARLAPFLAPLDAEIRARLRETWPGPVTWLLPAAAQAPAWITGAHASVAARVTAHPLAASLARSFGAPIVSTSANRCGRRPLRTALAVRRAFGAEVDCILAGEVGDLAGPTPIRDAGDGTLLRAGGDHPRWR